MTVDVFCLPFAGGSKFSYNGYVKLAPRYLTITPLELPGRGSRMQEALLTSVGTMTEDALAQIRPKLAGDRPYAIYGHSMGAVLGYLLAKRVIEEGLPAPVHLFFTGCGGPSARDKAKIRHDLPKEAFFKAVNEIGGMPSSVLSDRSFMDYFEPILRADFKAVETFSYRESIPFDIPISVFIGEEEAITVQDARAWQKETTAAVDVKQLPGNHFFIYDFESLIMQSVGKYLLSYLTAQKYGR
jgi:surfactin synthase thioesterase subunit